MKTFLFAAILACTGCASLKAPSPTEAAAADYGAFPADYEQIVQAFINDTFFDPYSVRDLTIDPPQKHWIQYGMAFRYERWFGYRITFRVNAKNRLGAYTGKRSLELLVRDGRRHTPPEPIGGRI